MNAPRSGRGRALFLELLMRLFADSARLDCPGQVLDGGVGRRVREIVFALAVRTMLAHQPGRSAERRGGKEGVRTGRSRWAPCNYKQKQPRMKTCTSSDKRF